MKKKRKIVICQNMYLIGRNNNRSPDGFAVIETNPTKALRNIADTNEELLNLLENFVHVHTR